MEIDVLIGICIIAIMGIIYMKYKKPSYKTEAECENIKRTEDTIDTYDDKGNKRVSVGIYKPNEKPTEEEITYIKDGVKGKGIMKRMPQGLQVFDANGNIVLDLTSRIMKVIDSVVLDGASGKIHNPLIKGQTVWICISRRFKDETDELYYSQTEIDSGIPLITVKDDTIYWDIQAPYFLQKKHWKGLERAEFWNNFYKKVEIKLIYGVY